MANKNTLKYYGLIKKHYMSCSDYALAQHLGVTRQAVKKWTEGGTISEETALILADRLGLDPLIVVSECNADRANTLVSQMYYSKLIKLIKEHPTVVAAGFMLCTIPYLQPSTIV